MTASSVVRIIPCDALILTFANLSLLESDWNNGQPHIDIWTGSNSANGGQNQINCEDNLTFGGRYSIVRNPPTNYGVDSTFHILRCLLVATNHLF